MNTALSMHGYAAPPGGLPRALPPWVYRHPEMTRLEFERILKPSWQIACHVSSVPRRGDYLTLELGPESVLVLRNRDDRIVAFHNVCRHRGTRLLDGQGHCAGNIVCPYHGWSYRQDGTLAGVSRRDSFPGLDPSGLSLRDVAVDIALGFVFVCLGEAPRPVSEALAPMLADLEPYQFERMTPLGPIYTEEWDADWKVVMDNYLESYHVPIGHPGLSRLFTPDYEDQFGVPGVARGTSWLKEQPSSKWSERMYQRLVGSVATHLPEPDRRCWRFYSLLPNLGLDVYPDQMDFFQVLPRGPGRTTIRGGLFGLPDPRREMRVARFLSDRINRQVNREDRWLCERVQKGLASSSYQPGPLSTIETWMLEFHELLRACIPEVRLDQAPESFARRQ
jgi:phenylpropionate dioxygenase-like ring-hydroxylating dioxygenase large terminal subunit